MGVLRQWSAFLHIAGCGHEPFAQPLHASFAALRDASLSRSKVDSSMQVR